MKKIPQAWESLRVHTRCLVAFEEYVGYDINFVRDFRTALFGGEGLFCATLTGSGVVYMRSHPFSRLAD
ncbi:MAG: AIM24 family protein [Spirochaetaceae bacterium]|nr:MAG: AIM24 family protein [Spirochaetaceae bacterium]